MVSPSTSPHLEHTRPPTAGSSSRTSSSRCNQCIPGQTVKGRNLVVCIDGTCNESGPNSTNVVKLYDNVDRESTNPKQLALYLEGIGTHPESSHFGGLTALLEMTIAFDIFDIRNVEKAVKKAYQWLAETYQEGDQIYLFGFSRGAYQVRVLAGMIHEVGLIKEMITENEIGKAYDYYEAVCQGKPTAMRTAREFKNTVSWQGVKVHFVGVWDTVSSVLGKDVFLSMSSSAEHACHFRHALALDERRVTFMPEYFYEVNSQMGVGKSMKDPDIKEVWFPGSHSDVWFRNAGHVSLLWMRREAAANGLVLNSTDIVWLPDDLDSGISTSMTRIWRPVEYLPIKHQVSFSGAGEHAVR
ncbi:hypothetical protein EV363DRAFT_1160695 [Boletus edulis]|nr:hypothetical protein EV363DRAFT_1160695 [Boletus edulis]